MKVRTRSRAELALALTSALACVLGLGYGLFAPLGSVLVLADDGGARPIGTRGVSQFDTGLPPQGYLLLALFLPAVVVLVVGAYLHTVHGVERARAALRIATAALHLITGGSFEWLPRW